jgi:hypothetical protein
MHKMETSTKFVPSMTQAGTNNSVKKSTLKVVVPEELKHALQLLADEQNITVSSLLRLVTSEYVKRQQST